MRTALLALGILAFPVSLCACLWDYDTLAVEAKGLPDVVEIITGRFERNPPLYYEMRLARASARIEADPTDLPAYDDAGVACDRLGRGDEAIAWMERKHAQLARPEVGKSWLPSEVREHEYRYLANVGTFWVHRWARSGADRARIAEVRTARDFIARAIALNPNAHFGREKYQLKALDWIIKPPKLERYGNLPGFLDFTDPANKTDEAVRGLAGLIALGNAWESVDVFNTLAQALKQDGDRSSVALLARLRCNELIDAGRRSLHPEAPTDPQELKQFINEVAPRSRTNGPKDKDAVVQAYDRLRIEANRWQRARTEYMMKKLRAGRHPDTDATFWSGYLEEPAPGLEEELALVQQPWWPGWMFLTEWGLRIGLLVVLVVVLSRLRLKKVRRTNKHPAPDLAEPGVPAPHASDEPTFLADSGRAR